MDLSPKRHSILVLVKMVKNCRNADLPSLDSDSVSHIIGPRSFLVDIILEQKSKHKLPSEISTIDSPTSVVSSVEEYPRMKVTIYNTRKDRVSKTKVR